MKNIILFTTTALLWAIPSHSMRHVSEPITPVGVVTIVDTEVEIEYLPEVTVTIVDAEVEIEHIPEG